MLSGLVIHGQGKGKKLGYPTANFTIEKKHIPFSQGIYSAYVTLHQHRYLGALVISPDASAALEVFLINYHGDDFYGELITVEPVQKVGNFERYDSTDELIDRIKSDIALIKDFFKERGEL